MPARDLFHDKVRVALEKDGWTVTDDPLKLEWEERKLYVDLGAERIFAAEKDERKIAVEIKSFVSLSEVKDLENALGQYFLYLKRSARKRAGKKTLSGDHGRNFSRLFSRERFRRLCRKEL